MVITSKKDFILPDGLQLKPLEPEFLNNIWPVTILDSGMRSLLIVGSIFVVAFLIAITLGIIGRGMPKIRGAFFSGFFFIAAIFIAFTAYVSISHWNAPDSVSEYSLGSANDATYTWLQANKIKGDKSQSLALVCNYYEAKSDFCKNAQASGPIGGGDRELKMDINPDGYMILIDSKNQLPIIEPEAK